MSVSTNGRARALNLHSGNSKEGGHWQEQAANLDRGIGQSHSAGRVLKGAPGEKKTSGTKSPNV